MSDKILLTGIKAFGFHGVFPEERREGQEFIVDVALYTDLKIAGESDDLSTTIDYSKVAKLVEAEIRGEPLNLIEALAERTAKNILSSFSKVEKVTITVHKPSAPIDVSFENISVSIERNR